MVGKLEPMAKGIFVPHDGSLVHRSEREIDMQVHKFSDRQFDGQYGRHTRFAHFDRRTGNGAKQVGPDRNVHLQFEPRVPPCIRNLLVLALLNQIALLVPRGVSELGQV
jgi:hypothetical protein